MKGEKEDSGSANVTQNEQQRCTITALFLLHSVSVPAYKFSLEAFLVRETQYSLLSIEKTRVHLHKNQSKKHFFTGHFCWQFLLYNITTLTSWVIREMEKKVF